MRIQPRRFITLSLLVAALLIFLLWLGQESDESTLSTDPESQSILDTGPEMKRSVSHLVDIADMKIDPATLGARFLLKGMVSTTEDEPIMGATVTLYGSMDTVTRELSDPLVIAVTGRHGRFEIQRESELTAWLRIDSPGFASVDEWIVLDTPGIRQRFYRLRRVSAAIVGVVRDHAGQPISGVFVGATFPKIYTSARTHFVSPQTTRSDTSGRFRLDFLPAGDVSLSFLKRGYLPTWESVQVTEHEVRHLEISLQEGRAFPIRVQNLRGQGLTSASINLDSGIGFPADEQGVVQILLPPETPVQEVSLEIRSEGYLSQSISFDPTQPQKTVTLEEGPLLEGRILSESGRPVADAKIAIWSGTGSVRGRLDAIVTPDADGTFSVHLNQQPIRRIDAKARGYVPHVQTQEQDPEGPIEILLRPGEGGIQGRVVDERGRPVELFQISLTEMTSEGRASLLHQSFENPQGTFSILDLSAGEYLVDIRGLDRNTHAPVSRGGIQVTVRKGYLTGEIIIQLSQRTQNDAPT